MAKENTRRLIRVGGSNCVPLPSSWIKAEDLKPGDPVEVVCEGHLALIRKGRS
jgi:antitoxin component of MazEF toxin-antitoxin module